MSLYPYLKAIEEGRFFNAQRLSYLFESRKMRLSSLGETKFVSKGKYSFEVTDQDKFKYLLSISEPSKSRSHAAKQGDSHKHPTNSIYLAARYYNEPCELACIACSPNTNPADEYGSDTPVILIENSDCFTFCEDFLLAMEIDDLLSHCLIILSNGNAITHRESLRFLDYFNNIYYCPDYDLAGITIYETLCKHLKNKPKFVIPNNVTSYKNYCFKPKSQKKFTKAIEKVEALNLPASLSTLFTTGLGFLEQEVFLGEYNEY